MSKVEINYKSEVMKVYPRATHRRDCGGYVTHEIWVSSNPKRISGLENSENEAWKDAYERLQKHSEQTAEIKKVEAMEFAEWCADNDKYTRVKDEKGANIWIDPDTPEQENDGDYYMYTTADLYTQFLTDKNKSDGSK